MADWGGYSVNPKLVARMGIYKDVVDCSDEASDYKLRPNFVIAMAVAPEMFAKDHAQLALDMVEKVLFVCSHWSESSRKRAR